MCQFEDVNKGFKNNTNQIVGVNIGDHWVKDVETVECEAKNHFQKVFIEPNMNRPLLDGTSFQ